MFSDASKAWSGLSSAERLAWTREAGGAGLGFARFVSVVTRRRMWSSGGGVTVPIPMAVPSPGDVTFVVVLGTATVDVTWTAPPFPGLYTAVMRFCVFPSRAARTSPGGWLFTTAICDAWSGYFDAAPLLAPYRELVVVGRPLGVEVAFWCSVSGTMSGYIPARCVVAA